MSQVTVKTDIPQTVNYQSCTVQAGTTTTLNSGNNATVTNVGTEYNAVLNFGIPRGKNAYEQAVEGGYTGTEQEFNTDLANGATYAGNARKWAEGSDADVTPLGGTHSSKGWAQEAGQIVSGKQDIIPDLDTIRSGAALGATSVQPADILGKADTDLSNLSQGSVYNVLKPQNTLMYVNASGVIATIGGRKFYKANADGCYAALFLTTDGFRMPVLVGETAESVMGYDDVDTTPRNPTGSFVWNGKTWYYQVSFYAMVDTFDYESSLPCLQGRHISSGTEPAQALLDLQFSTPKNALPVEVYQNGSSWYRVYSDGWCEQGGAATLGTFSYTFLKPYQRAPQVFFQSVTDNSSASTNAGAWMINAMPTATGFTISSSFVSTYQIGGYWEAKGYIA